MELENCSVHLLSPEVNFRPVAVLFFLSQGGSDLSQQDVMDIRTTRAETLELDLEEHTAGNQVSS